MALLVDHSTLASATIEEAVETLEEFAIANEIEHEVIERSEERRAELRATYADRFINEHKTGNNIRFLAWAMESRLPQRRR